MSDNSNSTGSSGSSTNSWTLLSPEEAAVENVGPVDDGTESLGDVPSLSEEVAGAGVEFKLSNIPVETVLSEEGHQVCQETSPESSEGPIPSSPGRMSPFPHSSLDPSDLDLESQPPVIHDIDTSSPSDNEHMAAIPFVTNIDLGAPLDIPAAEFPTAEPEESFSSPLMTFSTEPVLDMPAHVRPTFSDFGGSPVFTAEPKTNIPTETITAADTPTHFEAGISFIPESTEPQNTVPESLATELPTEEGPAPESIGSVEPEEEEAVEKETAEPPETVIQDEREDDEEPSSSYDFGDTSSFDDGLRRRTVSSFETPRPRTSDEEDEEEEVEFKLVETKEKPWFSLNKCIVGALILLFLGSLFLSGDFEDSELSDGVQSQDWLNSDPQDMKELLDKLTQENQQITLLEAQLQAQKEELDSALKAVAASGDESGKADLEKENAKLKEELSSLPELKKELESLRARVTELSQLTADPEMPPATPNLAPQTGANEGQSNQKEAGPQKRKDMKEGGRLKEELKRQKVLLEESRKRLEGMKKDGGDRKRVRDSLEEIQRKLSEQVERWGKKKPQESKWKGNKGKNNEWDHGKKEKKKEWKHSKEGGWKDKEEKKEKEWKSQKQNSHKEAWRKHQDEWQRKKHERRMDREERRKEKPWHSHPGKNSHSHPHHHQQHHHHQPHQHNHNDFWRDQEQKLRRNVRPQLGCSSVEDCASKEGLYPVELSEFEELLEGYLSKLEGSSSESKDRIRKLTAEFFEDGVFIHDRVLFSDFAEDVADILEDMVDVLVDNGLNDDDSLEEEMEEFEREALWKFSATA
ncbi:pre-B-cell leukemia transcription factor-interacting protein 1 isoform X2 [Mastacembelus armatus]|uniref:Pre-B-cell leukemia homeobox interacting protein 1a n=1 Tax=Mastacembelus armatus TaxID=205130 RepID=A0A3Q3MQD1_9TELE|nr:pre-B-cell leukemia transcription factor-interacting protein 1-like isoform X2 [Mastacembelus armatus]